MLYASRREFLKWTPIAIAGLLLLRRPLSLAAADGPKPSFVPPPNQPLGTCQKYQDSDGNGICDRSEPKAGSTPCGRTRCPANKGNPRWPEVMKNGAPKGVCANWDDSAKVGLCSVSTRHDMACPNCRCPANKNAAKKPVATA